MEELVNINVDAPHGLALLEARQRVFVYLKLLQGILLYSRENALILAQYALDVGFLLETLDVILLPLANHADLLFFQLIEVEALFKLTLREFSVRIESRSEIAHFRHHKQVSLPHERLVRRRLYLILEQHVASHSTARHVRKLLESIGRIA